MDSQGMRCVAVKGDSETESMNGYNWIVYGRMRNGEWVRK